MSIKIIKGKIPVLLSAPHVYPHIAKGYSAQNPKPGEFRTDEFIRIIAKETGSWTIMLNEPYLDKWSKFRRRYRNKVAKLIKAGNICLTIDIHGCKQHRPFLIDYDFIYQNKNLKECDTILENIFIKNIKLSFNDRNISKGFFRSIRPGTKTLTYFIRSVLNSCAIQLELNEKTRQNDKIFFAAVQAIIKSIKEINYENIASGL